MTSLKFYSSSYHSQNSTDNNYKFLLCNHIRCLQIIFSSLDFLLSTYSSSKNSLDVNMFFLCINNNNSLC